MFFVAFLMIPKCLFNTTLVESANFIENFLDVQCIKFSSVHYRLFVYFLPKTFLKPVLYFPHISQKKILNLHNVSHAGPKALTQIHSHSVAAALSLSFLCSLPCSQVVQVHRHNFLPPQVLSLPVPLDS